MHLAELTYISESSFMIYLVPDSVPRLGHTGPAESEGQLPLPPHILLELKSQNCSIKRHCNYLPLHIFRSVLAHTHYISKGFLATATYAKNGEAIRTLIQLIRKSCLYIAF